MDVAWQDSVGSFLDSSGTDASNLASFAGDDGATLWSSAGDSPRFSGQSVLWDSGPDLPADSNIAALTLDGTGGTGTSASLADNWLVDAGAQFAGFNLAVDGGLLWTAAGGNLSSSLTSNGGVGLGALDLGTAGSTSSQWQQFVDQFAGGSATGLATVPQLLWTGASSQGPITVPVLDLQSPPLGASSSLPLSTLGNLSPPQLVWTDSSQGAAGITSSPATLGAAPTPLFNLGGPTQPASGPFNLTLPQTTA